jgi:hypothetical protein
VIDDLGLKNGLADETDLRLRFDVLTKTRQPELHRYWTTRDRAANLRLPLANLRRPEVVQTVVNQEPCRRQALRR